MRSVLWMLCLAACAGAGDQDDDGDPPAGTDDPGPADTDVADDSPADTDPGDTDVVDTDVADTDAGGAYTGPIGSCDLPSGGYCQEYWTDLTTMAVYEGVCSDNGGAWADAACSHAGVVGGCRDASGGWITITNWFTATSGYANAHAVRTACQASGDTYVAP